MDKINVIVLGEREDDSFKAEWLPEKQRCNGYRFPKDNFKKCIYFWDTCIRNIEKELWDNGQDDSGFNVSWKQLVDVANEMEITWYGSSAFDASGKPLNHLIGLYVCSSEDLERLRKEINRRFYNE